MNAFQVYVMYLAMRAHFSSEQFDFFKFNKKVPVGVSSFKKRNDVYFFEKLAHNYTSNEVEPLLLANFVKSSKTYINKIAGTEGKEIFLQHKARINALKYVTKEQLKPLGDLNPIIQVPDGKYPELFQAYLTGQVDIDTIIAVDRAVNLLPYWDKNIKEKSLWSHKYFMFRKYSPFFKGTKEQMKELLCDVYA